jgi:hypothetical protein
MALALTLPKASAERIPANDVTTLANVLRSAFQPKALKKKKIHSNLILMN